MSETQDSTNGRTDGGRFAPGNPGGPGRPRRAVELDYLAALSDALKLEDWTAIVARAVTDAKAGDPKAREWVGRYALGAQPLGLADLARREILGVTPYDELEVMNDQATKPAFIRRDNPAFIVAADEKADREQAAQDEAERERKRAARQARKLARATQSDT